MTDRKLTEIEIWTETLELVNYFKERNIPQREACCVMSAALAGILATKFMEEDYQTMVDKFGAMTLGFIKEGNQANRERKIKEGMKH